MQQKITDDKECLQFDNFLAYFFSANFFLNWKSLKTNNFKPSMSVTMQPDLHMNKYLHDKVPVLLNSLKSDG